MWVLKLSMWVLKLSVLKRTNKRLFIHPCLRLLSRAPSALFSVTADSLRVKSFPEKIQVRNAVMARSMIKHDRAKELKCAHA